MASQLKDQPQLVRGLPLGRTPEGGRFPLIVVAVSPVTGERRLLDLRTITPIDPRLTTMDARDQASADPNDRTNAPNDALPVLRMPTDGRTETLEATTRPTAPRSRDDLVRLLVTAGWSVTQIRDVLKGTNTEIGALVRQIEDAQLRAAAAPLSVDDPTL